MLETSPTSVASPVDDRLRMNEAAAMARVSRGMIYLWLEEGRFGSWTVKRRGRERGLRYIDKASFENFLKSQRAEVPA